MRAAIRRGSSTTISPAPRKSASSSARGRRVVLPAPGSATSTRFGAARSAATRPGKCGSIGSACIGQAAYTAALDARSRRELLLDEIRELTDRPDLGQLVGRQADVQLTLDHADHLEGRQRIEPELGDHLLSSNGGYSRSAIS